MLPPTQCHITRYVLFITKSNAIDVYQVIIHVTNEAVFFGGEFGELDPIFIDDLISLTLHLDSLDIPSSTSHPSFFK